MPEISHHLERTAVHFRTLGLPYVLLLAAAAAALVVWHYRGTIPAVSGYMRYVLAGLRAAAFVLLILWAAEPVARLVYSVSKPDVTAVLLDTSASMAAPDDPSRKRDALDVLERIRSHLGKRGAYYSFDNELRPLGAGEPAFDGSATDIAGAIEKAALDCGAKSMILVSDGRWNLGEDPAAAGFSGDIPVHTVGVGTDAPVPEVLVRNVSYPPIGHEGASMPVEIVVSSLSGGETTVPVEVLEGGAIVASGKVSVAGGGMAKAVFHITLGKPGRHTFKAVVHPPEDTNRDNNSRNFTVRVLKSSFDVLLAAPAPSADLAFVRRAILSDSSFTLKVVIGRGTASGPGKIDPGASYDAVVVLDGGGVSMDRAAAARIEEMVSKGCGFWMLGSSLEGEGVPVFLDMLPVTFGGGAVPGEAGLYIAPTEQGKSHFITSGIGDSGAFGSWDSLPPPSSLLPIEKVTPPGAVLVEIKGKNLPNGSIPIIAAGKHGTGKVLVMPVSGIWRWRLMMEGAGKGGGFFTSFVLGTLRWLTSGADTSPLAVSTDKDVYLSGEEITFEAHLYDRVYMPVPGADVSLVIDDDPALKVILRETSPAIYTGAIRGINPGSHEYAARAFVGGTRFAESRGDFRVERFSLEMLDPRPARDVLAAIASRTGGMSVSPSGLDSLFAADEPKVTVERRERELPLSLHPAFPAAIILLLSVEWFIRKRRGML